GQAALLPEVEQFRLTPVLGDAAAIREWAARGERAFHLEIDTGMGRSGVRWDEIDQVRAAADTPQLEGCYTQFHSADRRDGTAEQQLERFERAVAQLVRRPALLPVANSAAALSGRQFAFDLVRPGVFLYRGSLGAGCRLGSGRARRWAGRGAGGGGGGGAGAGTASRWRSSPAGATSCSARC